MIKPYWTLKIIPNNKKNTEHLPVFDQPVVVSLFCAIAHNQHSMVYIVGTCVVPVHTCGATKLEDLHQSSPKRVLNENKRVSLKKKRKKSHLSP